MADAALFRDPLTEQYRPQTWADLVGQDRIVQRVRALAKRTIRPRLLDQWPVRHRENHDCPPHRSRRGG
jgi:replication-associated recombination protein RarA